MIDWLKTLLVFVVIIATFTWGYINLILHLINALVLVNFLNQVDIYSTIRLSFSSRLFDCHFQNKLSWWYEWSVNHIIFDGFKVKFHTIIFTHKCFSLKQLTENSREWEKKFYNLFNVSKESKKWIDGIWKSTSLNTQRKEKSLCT